MIGLRVKAWLALFALAVVMGLLLFIAAGSLRYWQAWGFLGVFFGASFLITLYLARRDPALLRRRLRGGPFAEGGTTQKIIMFLVSIGFVSLLLVPAFGHRFGWPSAPVYAVIAGDALVAAGFYVVFLVYRENSFASATIEVAADQRVVATGPYALVRHPMYAGSLLYLIGIPLALGSYWGLLPLPPMVPVLLWRLLDEEKLLARELPGYAQYQRRVPARLIPGIY